MKKEGLFVILFFLINISAVGASDEILLKSRRFIPAAGITAAAKAKIEAIPQRAKGVSNQFGGIKCTL